MLGEGGRQKENKNGKHWLCSLAIISRKRKKTGSLRMNVVVAAGRCGNFKQSGAG